MVQFLGQKPGHYFCGFEMIAIAIYLLIPTNHIFFFKCKLFNLSDFFYIFSKFVDEKDKVEFEQRPEGGAGPGHWTANKKDQRTVFLIK